MDTAMLAAFLADIKARPFDPTPRLILADWIDENGATDADHGRAALLRLSTQDLHCTAAFNSPLSEQTRTLFGDHSPAWLGTVTNAPGIQVYLRAGLLEIEATVSGWNSRDLRKFAESPGWLWVDGLTIKGNDQRFGRVWERPWLQTITRLCLTCGAQFLRPHWQTIFDSPHLSSVRALNLRGGQLEGEGDVARLAAWPVLAQVDSLNLNKTPLDTASIAALTASPYLAALRTLSLYGCGIGEEGARHLFRCPGLAGVEDLSLDFNNIAGAALAELASAPMAASLRRLTLASNALGDVGLQALATAPLPALRTLDIGFGQFEGPGAIALAFAPWCCHLESLNASGNALGRGGPALLLAPLENLHTLALGQTQLNADAADALRRTPHLRRLHSLYVANNPELGDRIVAALIGHPNLPEPAHLGLSRCNLSDVSALALASWPHLAALTFLDLTSNRLTDPGMRALVDSPHFRPGVNRSWLLSGNPVSLPLRRELAQRKPPLHV
jgi:uncharacterized protein (TIGR02996 family)